jgi:hypothetical protein
MRRIAAIATILVIAMSLAPAPCHACCAVRQGQADTCCADSASALYCACFNQSSAPALQVNNASVAQAAFGAPEKLQPLTAEGDSANGSVFARMPERPRPPGVLRI